MSISLLALCLLPAISPSAIVSRCLNCFLVDFMRLDCLFFLSSQGLAQYLAGTELKSWRAKEGTLRKHELGRVTVSYGSSIYQTGDLRFFPYIE